jgi:Tol biopolymer transport system component
MIRSLRRSVLLACILAACCSSVFSQDSGKSRMDDVVRTLFAGKTFAQVAVSPDGKQVAWVENQGGGSQIHVSAINGANQHRVSAGHGDSAQSEDSIAWSPDSKWLAFLSDAAMLGQQQVYLVSAGGGPARKLTSVTGFLAAPGWSPDGKSLAVLFTENATRVSGPLAAENARTGVIRDEITEQRLAVIEVASGKLRQISHCGAR